MDEELQVSENELALIDVNSIADTLSTLIEQGTDTVMTFLASDEVADALETAKGIGEELSKAVKVVTIIRKAASIPDKFFMRKIERYCAGLSSIPLAKREKYAKKVGKKSLNKDTVFILGVLNRTEELSKADFFVRLFEAKMDEEIDDQTYRRLMLQVDRTMFSDILYLADNIHDGEVKITSVEEENLLAMGWLIFAGIGIGNGFEDGGNVYTYTQTAKLFCKIAFGNDNITLGGSNPPIGMTRLDPVPPQ